MISNIKIIIVFLFVFTMLKTESLVESNISKPIGANYIQFTVDTNIDNKFLDYLEQNDIEIYRAVDGLPYYYTSDENNNIIYPFDKFSIEDKLLSTDNSGDYAVKFNGNTDYNQMANFLKANYDLDTVNHNLEILGKIPVFFTKQTLPVMVISVIALMICIYVETSKSAKEILIQKINGYSYWRITTRLLTKDLKEYIALTLLSLILYTVYSGYLSYTELLFTLLLLVVIMSFSFVSRVIFIRLTKLPINGNTSKSKVVNALATVSCASIMLALIAFYILPVYQGIYTNIYQIVNFVKLVDAKSEYQGYYFVDEEVNMTGDLDIKTFENAMENGGFTFQVLPQDENIVQVDEGYINSFLPQLSQYSLIAPQSKFEQIENMCKNSEGPTCKNIYYYEGEQRILSYELMSPGYIYNPIILVANTVATSFILPISSEDILDEIEEDYESDYTVGRQYYDIEAYIQKEIKSIMPLVMKNIAIFISFIMAVLITSQLYIEYYLQRNKTEILVKVVNGISGSKIYNQLIYLYSYMLVITLIIIVIISKLFGYGVYPTLTVLLIYGLIGIISRKYINKYIENYYGGR